MKSEQKFFLIGIFILFLALVLALFLPFISPLILGMLLALVFHPLYIKIGSRIKNENLRSFLVTLLIAIIILGPFALIILGLVNEAVNISSKIGSSEWERGLQILTDGKNLFGRFENMIFQKFGISADLSLKDSASGILSGISSFLYTSFNKIVSNGPKFVISFLILIMTTFYYLRDGEKLKEFFLKLSPLDNTDDLHLLARIKEVGRAIFYGNIVSALAQGFFGGLGFWIFGLGSPVLWGTIMAFLAIIPVLGPFIIFIPAGIYLLVSGNTLAGILFFVYNFIIVSSVDNLIRPFLIGGKVKIHPFLVLLSILGGLILFGIMGIIYGPLILVIFLTLTSLYLKNNQHKNL